MSRIGKQNITLPQGTTVTAQSGVVTVKGAKGELSRALVPDIEITVDDNGVSVVPTKKTKQARALWGTYASHIKNMVAGVNEPFQKNLIIEGVGFKADVQGNKLVMSLGFSHPVEMDIPEGITVTVEKEKINVSGIDKERVGQFAAEIRAKKKPEPFKGKGVRYSDEVVRRKQGKKAVGA